MFYQILVFNLVTYYIRRVPINMTDIIYNFENQLRSSHFI